MTEFSHTHAHLPPRTHIHMWEVCDIFRWRMRNLGVNFTLCICWTMHSSFLILMILSNAGSSVLASGGRDRILSEEELNRFDRHAHRLETLLDVERKHFLDILVNRGCITERHKDGVSVQLKKVDKNRELLSIIRRRSYADYVTFVDALKKTKQRRVLQLLEQTSGELLNKFQKYYNEYLINFPIRI